VRVALSGTTGGTTSGTTSGAECNVVQSSVGGSTHSESSDDSDSSTSSEGSSPIVASTSRFAKLLTRKQSMSGKNSANSANALLSDSHSGTDSNDSHDNYDRSYSDTAISATTTATIIERKVYTKQAIVFLDEKQQQDVNLYAATVIAALGKLESVESNSDAHNEGDGTPSTDSSTKQTHPTSTTTTTTTTPTTTAPTSTMHAITISQRSIDKQKRVGVLQESMTLDARARTLDAFR